MRKHWIGIIKWNDGTILKTEPFYDYDEGIKAWSSKFSYENKGKFEWIDYEKIEPKQERMYSDKEVKHLMTLAFEQGFKKADVVEAGLEAKETDTEVNWIFLKHKK